MLVYLLFTTLLTARCIWTHPVQQQVTGDVPSHIVIVTPQAQVHLESGLKYDAPATFIHHLSPLARFAGPHEETIVYVPASGGGPASLVPIEALNAARSSDPSNRKTYVLEPKQYEQISQQIEQITTQIQQGASMYGPQLSEAAASAAAAASSAGAGLFPGLFPPTSAKDDKYKTAEKNEYPANTQPLLTSEPRHYYAISPAIPHIVDFVHSPVFVGPLSTIRTRSIQEKDIPVVALPIPEASKPEALPLQSDLKETAVNSKEPLAQQPEKKTDYGRFLEANALKEDNSAAENFSENFKKDNLKTEQELAASNNIADAQPILGIADGTLGLALTKTAQEQPEDASSGGSI